MKKFLLLAVGILMFLAADAAPVYKMDRQQTDQTLLVQQSDCQEMVVDFAIVDYSIYEIASTAGTESVCYVNSDADVRTQVFDFTTPVYRLCRLCVNKSNICQLNIKNLWRGNINMPPSQYHKVR